MGCGHGHYEAAGLEGAFAIQPTPIVFGRGCLAELGAHAKAAGMSRVALFTDARVAALPWLDVARRSLAAAGVDIALYDAVHVEPTDASCREAARFARDARVDGYVSLGGGSVIDTCKVADLLATGSRDGDLDDALLAYVAPPLGRGVVVSGPLAPHIACPTTCGTGSECTGIAVFDLRASRVKTGIAHRHLKPTMGLVDPRVCATLPAPVVAASGFDVLCHALESYTARPYTRRAAPPDPAARPLSQGQNPWSDIGCAEALRLLGPHLVRAVHDAGDVEARDALMWSATLAGVAFGNAGVHAPHAMSYAVAGLVRDHRPDGWPAGEALVPHGMAVVVNAPAVFRHTAASAPERHLAAAAWLGADVRGARDEDAGEVLAARLVTLMEATRLPTRLATFGYGAGDVPALARGAFAQQRLVTNSPVPLDEATLAALYAASL